jgi:hypothetical protein
MGAVRLRHTQGPATLLRAPCTAPFRRVFWEKPPLNRALFRGSRSGHAPMAIQHCMAVIEGMGGLFEAEQSSLPMTYPQEFYT